MLTSAAGQGSSSAVYIITVYSQNEQFYLKSIPFDNKFPSLPGLTQVYEKGSSSPLYSLDRAFDSVEMGSNNLVLSNDGQIIFYATTWGAKEEVTELKSVSIYKRGKLAKEYTKSEITSCDLSKERCDLVYSNYDEVIDRVKSNSGSARYKKTFKSGVSDQDKFLSDYAIFASDDVVYLTDSKKNVHRFSLSEAKHLDAKPFPEIYDLIKAKGRSNKIVADRFEAPIYLDFPTLRSGVKTGTALGRVLGMKVYDNTSSKDEKYKSYSFTVSGFLNRDGSFELTDIDVSSELPKEKILSFFAGNKFQTSSIPSVFERWKLDEEYFFFRKADDVVAVRERQEQIRKQQEELKKRLVAETVSGRYIPRDLSDAFQQLDEELSEVDRKEMTALAKRDDMIAYHLGLGMWMRNNWGLWGGSRLQKYFREKGIGDPEEMSSVILFLYWDWLHGNKEISKEWEKNPKSMFDKK